MLVNNFRWNLLFYEGIRQGFQHANTCRTKYCIASISNRLSGGSNPRSYPRRYRWLEPNYLDQFKLNFNYNRHKKM